MLKGSFVPYALRSVGRVAEHLLQQARETLETVQINQVPRARRSCLRPREPFGERIGTEPVGMEDVEQAQVSHPLGPDQLFTAGGPPPHPPTPLFPRQAPPDPALPPPRRPSGPPQ